jgi:hypothetical protein
MHVKFFAKLFLCKLLIVSALRRYFDANDRLPKKTAETQRFNEQRNPSADVDGMTMESASHVASNKHPHGRSCIAPPRRKRPCIPNIGNDFWQKVYRHGNGSPPAAA